MVAEQPKSSACRALCIEPSGSLRVLLACLGEKHGWRVETAEDLSDALLAPGTPVPDLVLTAGTLPSGNYVDVVRRVRAHPDHDAAAIPVVLLTADAGRDGVQEALEHGVTEVFLKSDLGTFGVYLDSVSGRQSTQGQLSGRALVLDDDQSMAAYTAALLSALGLSVDCVHSFDDALGMALVTAYDLMVVDVILGSGPTGNQFVRLLRHTVGQAQRTPVIVVSGFADSARRLDAMRAGANAFLTKPLNEAELAFHVRKLLAPATPVMQEMPGARVMGERAQDLSKRERAICGLVVSGLPDKRIAERLGISYWTVRSHMASIFRKCQVMNRVELATLLRNGEEHLGPDIGQAQAAVVDWLSLSSHVLEGFQYGVMVADKMKKILHVNEAFSRITGYGLGEVLGKTPNVLRSGRHGPDFYRGMHAELDSQGSWRGEVWNRHKNGAEYLQWLEIRVLGPEAPMGAHYVAVLSDISSRLMGGAAFTPVGPV